MTDKAGFTGDLKTTGESVTPHVESFDNHIGDGDGLTKVSPKESQDLSRSYLMAQLDKVLRTSISFSALHMMELLSKQCNYSIDLKYIRCAYFYIIYSEIFCRSVSLVV